MNLLVFCEDFLFWNCMTYPLIVNNQIALFLVSIQKRVSLLPIYTALEIENDRKIRLKLGRNPTQFLNGNKHDLLHIEYFILYHCFLTKIPVITIIDTKPHKHCAKINVIIHDWYKISQSKSQIRFGILTVIQS